MSVGDCFCAFETTRPSGVSGARIPVLHFTLASVKSQTRLLQYLLREQTRTQEVSKIFLTNTIASRNVLAFSSGYLQSNTTYVCVAVLGLLRGQQTTVYLRCCKYRYFYSLIKLGSKT